ncbi:MAG: 50S ribosomal protein L15 [Candidatus Hydrogenedentes bacterium]|nr:50S ribosomal protein L15 [Candidatus Hydrogenedentota bacterium]
MRLNTLSPAPGRIKAAKRVGRGIGSGLGKTCGRGHKGQKARAGGKVRPGFEGGQMPLQKRLPKYGFSSRLERITAEVRLGELNRIAGDVVDLITLRAAGLVTNVAERARIFLAGELQPGRALVVRGVAVSKGARAAIEVAGGRVEEG